ncbi:hypothetical protein T265_10111 [Opisthorchis viverrini]|uniref:SCP domain-containing protein n=1 Tax=Opisthorchis viverrini TaxID=6198 RepID=A0A074Z7R5_OPIVI|nr:hypothetical protein T265_10111 [Opisthorchis viverrini]KER21617.1 hypothetical protein T265_10111 [Opisthorchis viverrini]
MSKVRFARYVLLLLLIQPSRERTSYDQRQTFLTMHNHLRDEIRTCKLRGQPPVKGPYEPMAWDSTVEAQAQKWADKCLFGHGELQGVGQNVAIASSVERAVKLWAEEYVNYDFAKGKCKRGKQCLHYTQMAWASSTSLGCGVKHCPKNGTTLYVCNYKPPGNYRGQKPYTAGTKKDCLTSTTVNGPKQKRSTTSGSGNLWQTRKTTAAKLISFLLILLLVRSPIPRNNKQTAH